MLGVTFLRMEQEAAVLRLAGGAYHFLSSLQQKHIKDGFAHNDKAY